MKYQIESKSDLTGAILVIRFPEEDLDTKALYTIQADQPDFLVPFRYRCVNGEAECTYQLGSRIKLLYRCSSKTPGELTGFWEQILQPLLDCGDWFLTPFSFVLDTQYLYTDREGKTVSYLYIPSKQNCADIDALRNLAVDLAQKNPSTDAGLEVKILRAIMQNFQPKAFLQMLREAQPAVLVRDLIPPQAQIPSSTPAPAKPNPVSPSSPDPVSPSPPPAPKEAEIPHRAENGDIQINLSGNKGDKKEKKGIFGTKEEKKEKKDKKDKKEKKGGLFGKKKEPPKEMLLGAAAEPLMSQHPLPASPAAIHVDTGPDVTEEDGVTVLLSGDNANGAYFRLVGDQTLPREIPLTLAPGGMFTIGRYDVTIGRRQSDFEFAAKTKAVSRHHAVVERVADGSYVLVDLDSAAGTFLNGERLTPNVARPLTQGCRVSFGTAGADYIWEE